MNNKRKNIDECPKILKQLKLDDSYGKTKVSQSELNKLTVAAVCDAMLPHTIVDNKSVRSLLQAGFPGRKILKRKALFRNIDDDFKLMQEDMKKEFQKLDSVCLTVDSWTSYRWYAIFF